jgi:hypothetical protein
MMYPRMTWKYPKAPYPPFTILPTVPGTDTNVTPERDVPIIPNATKTQFEFRFPIKKVSLVAFLDVYAATPRRIRKYPITKEKSRMGDILQQYAGKIT